MSAELRDQRRRMMDKVANNHDLDSDSTGPNITVNKL
jgi:hypothetical protein